MLGLHAGSLPADTFPGPRGHSIWGLLSLWIMLEVP